jgi:hypothetical protein
MADANIRTPTSQAAIRFSDGRDERVIDVKD